jgi:GNAT superfamily N-acetyltransferase
MDYKMKIIDLKKDDEYISQYIELRNSYSHLLLTDIVKKEETVKWIKNSKTTILGTAKNNELLGVIILYLDRDNEIAIFTKEQKKGIGTLLLTEIEKTAKKNNINKLWAWVRKDNIPAQKLFEKNGYKLTKNSLRKYDNKDLNGFVFQKTI